MNKNFSLFLLYILCAALLYPFLKYYIDSADTLQYITIAKVYADGNFFDALNSFWNPLIPWLLIPFIKSGIEAVFAFKILQAVIGLFTLSLIFYFIDRGNPAKWIGTSLKMAAIPFVVSNAFLFSTPDLLLLTFYLWFVRLLKNNSSPLLTGICGAAMYFTKGFGFAFFISASALVFLYRISFDRTAWKKAATGLFKSYSIFFLLCAPWIFLISLKENRFVISSAGTTAINLINPALNPDPFDDIHYPFEKGILSEPPSYAVSGWLYQHHLVGTGWSPFDSNRDFVHYLKMISRNIVSVISFHFGMDAGIILVLAMVLLFAFRRASLRSIFKENAMFLIVCFTCTALYILVITIHRYLWINDIAIIVLFSAAVQNLFEWKRWTGYVFMTAFILLLLYSASRSFSENINDYKEIYRASQELKTKYDFRGNVVSLLDSFPDRNHRLSHLVAYYTGSWYYGMADQHNADELQEKKIDFVLDWNHSAGNWLKKNNSADEVAVFPGINLSVYKMRHLALQTD